MAQRNPSKITTDLLVDDPLVIGPGYRIDDGERRYLDNQIRGIQQHLVDALIRGRHATYVLLDGASAAVAAGDVVCDACVSSSESRVTKAVAAALTNAGAAFGVVVYGGAPGSYVLVALGGFLPPTLTSLGSTAGFVRVNTTTARCERVASIGASDYPVGTVGSTGQLAIAPFPRGAGGSGEANTASNVGTGVGVWKDKVGADLRFRSILAGANVTVTLVGDDIVVASTGGGGGGSPGGSSGALQTNDGAGGFAGINVGTTDQIIKSNGSAWIAGALNLAAAAAVTGILAIANGGTGLSALGAGVQTFLGTPSSANLAAAVTDETGSGALVFATSPTLVTPNIGAATGTSLALSSFLSAGGGTPNTAEAIRLPNNSGIGWKTSGGTDRALVFFNGSNIFSVGTTNESTTLSGFALTLASGSSDLIFSVGGAERGRFINSGLGLYLSDSDQSHYYVLLPSNLAASRNCTLPILAAHDTFVFEAHAQSLTNKTFLAFGSSPAASGVIRLEASTGIYWNNSGTVLPLAEAGTNACYYGTTSAFGGGNQAQAVNIYAAGTVALGIGSSTYLYVYSPNVALEAWKPITGSDSGSSPHALSGRAAQAMADANQTAAAAVYMMACISCTGALTANRDLTLPLPASEIGSYPKYIQNSTTGGFSIIAKCSSGTTATITAGTHLVFVTPGGVALIA